MTSPPEEAKEVESRPRKLVVHVVHSRLLAAPALDRVLSIALAAIGVVAFASCGVVAAARVGDDSRLDSAAGSWMALAHYLNDRILYPPLYDGHFFGGTRYMQLSIVLLAGIERLIGDLSLAAKALSIVTAVALFSVVFLAPASGALLDRRLSGSRRCSRDERVPVCWPSRVAQRCATARPSATRTHARRADESSMATRGGGRPLCPRAGREILGPLGRSGDRDLARPPTSCRLAPVPRSIRGVGRRPVWALRGRERWQVCGKRDRARRGGRSRNRDASITCCGHMLTTFTQGSVPCGCCSQSLSSQR